MEDYLKQKCLPNITDLDHVSVEQLPKILESFYVDVRTQKCIYDENGDPLLTLNGDIQYEEYTNNSLRSLRAALNRYFKLKLNVNIMDNPAFIRANELFAGKLRINKEAGKGTTRQKDLISDQDLLKLNEYFKRNMAGPPNAVLLQEMMLFNVIFYMGRRGRENLRFMKKNTFAITKDANDVRYIYQQTDEADKNHNEKDLELSNQARIYEVKGKSTYTPHVENL